MTQQVRLAPVDAADVTIVVDNAIDVLAASNEVAHRAPLAYDAWSAPEQLRAEHGYSLWVTVERGGRRDTLLYDAGLGRQTAVHNLALLGYDLKDVRTVVFSHGHSDHHTGLEGITRALGRTGVPLVLHPDAWRDRRIVFPSGNQFHLPPPSHQDLDREGWQVVEERGPSLLLEDSVLVTGEVERVTGFERGFATHEARASSGDWEPDTWVWDDQAVVIHLRDKGLLVLSSCSHAGAINMLQHARRLTGVEHVHAFVGGMHLTGALFEPLITPTLHALYDIAPDVVVPGHCTGWRATNQLISRLPDAYIQSLVGTRLHFVGGV